MRAPDAGGGEITTPLFRAWRGAAPEDTFGRKPLLDFHGEMVFAELGEAHPSPSAAALPDIARATTLNYTFAR